MLEKIIALDKEVLIYLNSLGSIEFDGFWLLITKQINWLPLFILAFYLLYKKIGMKNLSIVIVVLSLLILFCDQFTNLVKFLVKRLRPCNDPEIKDIIRVVKESPAYSFFSAHASNSMAVSVFVFMILKKYYKYSIMLFLFPLIFAYSRIYLGLHFPTDILVGYLFGGILGFYFYKLYLLILKKYNY